jgi:hypothetical protein
VLEATTILAELKLPINAGKLGTKPSVRTCAILTVLSIRIFGDMKIGHTQARFTPALLMTRRPPSSST